MTVELKYSIDVAINGINTLQNRVSEFQDQFEEFS